MQQGAHAEKEVLCKFTGGNNRQPYKVNVLRTSDMIRGMFNNITPKDGDEIDLSKVSYADFNKLYPAMELIAKNKISAIKKIYQKEELPELIQCLNSANYLEITPLVKKLVPCIAQKCDLLNQQQQNKILQEIKTQLPEANLFKSILSHMTTLIPTLEERPLPETNNDENSSIQFSPGKNFKINRKTGCLINCHSNQTILVGIQTGNGGEFATFNPDETRLLVSNTVNPTYEIRETATGQLIKTIEKNESLEEIFFCGKDIVYTKHKENTDGTYSKRN